ncbi:MAG: glycosyl transferase family protein [bacterium]
MAYIDLIAGVVFPLLAVWILLSGLDDMVIAAAWIYTSVRRSLRIVPPGDPRLAARERRIAIFIPLWHEEAVVRRMIERNLSAIRYGNYEVFAGCYPNDPGTLAELRICQARFPRLHVAISPRNGPTSKADCLNVIWHAMKRRERETGTRFEAVVIHDAEDVVHPEELRWANYYTRGFGMVQVPVLPLATPAGQVTHGVYCDEFAEMHTKDIPARQALGGFVPSAGVGTAYSRAALDALAGSGTPFDPSNLTEDYDSGYRIRRAGFRQLFIPIHFQQGIPAATREYFPTRARDAVRQRTRWVTGISLQGWQNHGWGRGVLEAYWFLHDRKGLIGSPASLIANALFVYSAAAQSLGREIPADTGWFAATFVFGCLAQALRVYCCGRVYGWAFAAGVPLRAVWGNWLNAAAAVCAISKYSAARMRGATLSWAKTEHIYPEADVLAEPAHVLPASQAARPIQVR